MRVFVIDTRNMVPELQGGLIGVVGSEQPSSEEKKECVDTVSQYATDGWAIAADPHTPKCSQTAFLAPREGKEEPPVS